VTINRILHDAADSHNYTYIELYKHFVRPQTNLLDAAYTTDGLHLNGQGYNLWAQLLQPYINE
ncbi:MAG: sialate O-acetylesterase, partial [Bacteroidaceae bacterium]|nr:sialate O-acetylesterase [Bacteroidaceae bacterium]